MGPTKPRFARLWLDSKKSIPTFLNGISLRFGRFYFEEARRLRHIAVGPVGQITSPYQKYVNPLSRKYCSSVFQKDMILCEHPASIRGAYASSRTLRRDAMDASASH